VAEHELIKILAGIPPEKLQKVSPRSVLVKKYVKLPVFLAVFAASMLSAFATVLTKITDTFIQTGLF